MQLVDTSVWVEFLRRSGNPAIQARLRPLILQGEVVVTEWILLELMTGLGATEKASDRLARFAPIRRVPFPDDGWTRSWDLASSLRKRGVTSSAADCFIATVAMSVEVPLIHCDSDFEAIAAHSTLQTIDWTSYLETRGRRADKRRKAPRDLSTNKKHLEGFGED